MPDALVVAIAVALGGIAQAITGLGFALVCSPFLVAVLGPREGVRLILVLSAILNTAFLAREHSDVRRGDLMRMLVPAAIVTPLMSIAIRHLDSDVLAVAAAVTTVLAAAALGWGLELSRASGRGGAIVAGAISGTTNVIAGISGPPVALYAINGRWTRAELRSTLQGYFLALNLVAMVFLGLPSLTVWPFVGLAVGVTVGPHLAGRVPDGMARAGTLSLAAAAGIATIVRVVF